MCTSVVETAPVEGAATSAGGWIAVNKAVISYDHPHHALLEDAITIDFVDGGRGPEARAAVEISLESAKRLRAALDRVIAEADEGGRAGRNAPLEGGRRKAEGGIPAVREPA